MKRYLYYISLTNILANIISAVPKILIEDRQNGAINAVIVSLPIGIFFIFFFAWFFSKFPGKGLPELLKEFLPKWFSVPFQLIVAILWFAAGLLTLTSFIFTLKRFLSPDTPLMFMAILFLIFLTFGMIINTKSVLYTMEIVFVIAIPLIVLLILKGITSEQFEWDFVMQVFMNINKVPAMPSFAASIFIYLGIANLIIVNRVYEHNWKFHVGDCIIIGLISLVTLLIAFLFPIGLLGFDNVGTIIYPSITSTDALRMPLGLVERVIYVALSISTTTTFLSNILHWHVTIQLLKDLIKIKQLKWNGQNFTKYLLVAVLWLVSLIVIGTINEYLLFLYATIYYQILVSAFVFMIFVLLLIRRKAKA